MKEIGLSMLMGLLLVSCAGNKQYATDCAPKREKHVNKMQVIPMPADTAKPENRPKFD